jgi:hypothetical protein
MKPISFEVAEPVTDPLEKSKTKQSAESSAQTKIEDAMTPESEVSLEQYRENAQAFIDRYSKTGFFASFSGDTSIRFKLGQAFYFDFQKGEVNLATDWFYNKGFSERQILWACMHEIGHFDDFKNDPERLMKNFDHIADEARKTGDTMLRKWEAVLDQSDPKQKAFLDSLKKTEPVNPNRPEMGSFNRLAQSAYGIHHPFYNSIDDIWVNNSVSRKAASFERGTDGGKEIESLYKEKLFSGFDYSKGESRHRQFINKLLRDDNVPDEQCIVTPDVEEALNRKLKFGGKSYTAKELIATFIKPRTGRDTKAGERYAILRRTLEPIFKELLAKDIADWKPEWKPPEEQPQSGQSGGESSESKDSQGQQEQENINQAPNETDKPQESKDLKKPDDHGEKEKGKPQEPQESKEQQGDASEGELPPATPFEKEIKDWKENTIDQLPPEAMKEIFKKFEEVKEKKEQEAKKAEASKHEEEEKTKAQDEETPEEKAASVQRKQDEQWAEKNASREYSKEQLLENLERFRRVQEEIAPYLDELSALWRHIIFGTSREIVRGMEGHFKTGDELDVQKTIENWGNIQEGKFEQAKIFRKIEDKEVVTQKPELIRIRIAGDMSGSMDEEKLKILQQAMTLIFASLDEFQTYLNATRADTKSKLEVETEGWVFNNSAEKIKSLDDKENLEMVSIFNHIQDSGGGTYDNTVLSDILDSLSQDDEEKIKSGKIMDIVFEITDGGSSDPDSAKEAVDKLIDKKVITRAFQIGRVSIGEQHTFDAVWNQGRDKSRGECVGVNIPALIPAITKALKEYLGDVSI